GRRAWRGLQFGLVHLVVGIPIAAALAITLGGWWFTWVYLRAHRRTGSADEALAESTRAHLGYDLVVVALVAASVALAGCALPDPSELRLESPDLSDGGPLAERFTCTGDNAVPTLRWSGGPSGVGGWAVVVEDPDAPTGTFTHWLVTGLGAATRSVGAPLPAGAVDGLTSAGHQGYAGPCPPTGETHHYRFRVHALSQPLALDPATAVPEARRQIEALSLDAAEEEVTYRTP
ncbi:MAG: YbhB/YbcL family Raf kinase inhibitor-like protein, partial [Acidimicrobiales bacterium]